MVKKKKTTKKNTSTNASNRKSKMPQSFFDAQKDPKKYKGKLI